MTEKTARLLEADSIRCDRRGETFLKGKGHVTTYWVRPHETSIYETISHSAGLTIGRSSLGGRGLVPSARNSTRSVQNIRSSILIEKEEEETIISTGNCVNV